MESIKYYQLFLVSIILFSSIGVVIGSSGKISGNYVDVDTFSNVSLNKYLSVDFSSEFDSGINFGEINFLPAIDQNATHNYDGVSNGSTFYANVSTNSNVASDFCILADGDLQSSGGDSIGVENETYSYFNETNSTHPGLFSETSLNTTYVPSGTNIPIGGMNYWRFWLDVPSGQSAGAYNNTVYVKAIETGAGC